MTLAKALKIWISKSKGRANLLCTTRQSKHFGDAIVEHYEKFIGNWRDAKKLSGLHGDIIGYYVYLIWDLKWRHWESIQKLYLNALFVLLL